MNTKIFSIGHSNFSYEAFRYLLQMHHINALVDVRTAPYSKYCADFNQNLLKKTLEADGITYVYLGDALGGRPRDSRLFCDGVADYEKMAQTENFQRGIARLVKEAEKFRIAMMCSEANPLDCHRCLLVGRFLYQQKAAVQHILSNGELLDQNEVEQQLLVQEKQDEADMFDSLAERIARAYLKRASKAAFPQS